MMGTLEAELDKIDLHPRASPFIKIARRLDQVKGQISERKLLAANRNIELLKDYLQAQEANQKGKKKTKKK